MELMLYADAPVNVTWAVALHEAPDPPTSHADIAMCCAGAIAKGENATTLLVFPPPPPPPRPPLSPFRGGRRLLQGQESSTPSPEASGAIQVRSARREAGECTILVVP